MLRSIMKLAKNRKMIKVNPMTEVEPIRYKVKGFKDWSNVEIELFRLGPEHVSGGRLAYRQKKTGAEIDIPVVPHLKLRLRRSLRCQSGNSFLRRNSAKPSPRGDVIIGLPIRRARLAFLRDARRMACVKPAAAGWPKRGARLMRICR